MTLILVLGLFAAQAVSLLLHLQDRASPMEAGQLHPGMAPFAVFPLRFIWHVSLTFLAVIMVSLVAVRWATKPLKRMADAATAFAHDIDAAPLEECGPIEVRRATEAFNFMQARLRQLVVERARGLAAISHDLRTPLTLMRLRAELIEDPVLQEKMNADIDTMHGMVNGVLAYLRGLEDSEPAQPINMEALLHSMVEDERALGHKVVLLEPSAGERQPASYTGKLSILRRAITNLIENAVAHGQTVSAQFVDSTLALQVVIEDDGPGIPDANLDRVTQPFVRLDGSRGLATGGVGLGLAIVCDAAAYHGGQLTLENRQSGGLRATLVLPRTSSTST